MPLSEKTTAVILGSILGDGSLRIHKGYRHARFSFRHSERQSEYFYWKVEQLQEIAAEKSVFRQQADGYGTAPKLRFQSRALEALTELYRLTHKKDCLRIRRTWLNRMTPLSLAVWWFDDGSLIANGRRGVICTDGFDEESVKILARYLDVVWGITVHVGTVGKKRDGKQDRYWRLWFRSTEELKKFLRLILPYTPVPSMLPKILLLYNDRTLQQRWISEVAKLSGFSTAVIETALREKRKKWKRYRE